ncbi:uncharacterized protein LOC124254704 [Haliotis rubra]|uniref:uncharacterized protein LOC124254704 n=1 Tax=Haliotis rubra TaxID=36100 RepID=UPI001EE5A533|nr:uncharacterized protein LOC124254704 [Haliotis rubra]
MVCMCAKMVSMCAKMVCMPAKMVCMPAKIVCMCAKMVCMPAKMLCMRAKMVCMCQDARGGRYLVVGGFMYRVSKRKRDWISWICTAKGCKSTASTTNDIVTMVNDEHNHQTVTRDIKAKETLEKLKVKAASTLQPMQSLYEEGLIDMRDGSWNDETKATGCCHAHLPGAGALSTDPGER